MNFPLALGDAFRRARRGPRGATFASLLALALAPSPIGAAAAAPEVVVTIKPVHSLVAGVMAGVGRPALLIEEAASPHGYALRPSQARALSRARVIVWVGPELERFLERALRALAGRARIVTLMEAPGVTLLAYRAPQGEGEERAPPGHERGVHDPHLWLDPDNARAIVRTVAAALGEMDAANQRAYQANAERVIDHIAALDGELGAALDPVREVPFLVAHDAYRYFTRHYRLNGVGAVAPSPDRPPGARRIVELGRLISTLGIHCILSEPQFRPALVDNLLGEGELRTALLDPMGAHLEPGPAAWFGLMRSNAGALKSCLGGSG